VEVSTAPEGARDAGAHTVALWLFVVALVALLIAVVVLGLLLAHLVRGGP
jgi:hypothetical protein